MVQDPDNDALSVALFSGPGLPHARGAAGAAGGRRHDVLRRVTTGDQGDWISPVTFPSASCTNATGSVRPWLGRVRIQGCFLVSGTEAAA